MDVLIWVTLLISVCDCKTPNQDLLDETNITTASGGEGSSSTDTPGAPAKQESVGTQPETKQHLPATVTHSPRTEGLQSTLTYSAPVHRSSESVSTNTTEETTTSNVTDFKEPQIHVYTTIKEGDALNLTCSVDSFPGPSVKWTKSYPDKTVQEVTGNETQTQASLLIPTVRAEDSGQYICTAEYQGKLLTEHINITVTSPDWLSQLLEAVKQPRVLIVFSIGVVIGILLSSIVACVAVKCNRKKQKRSVDLSQNLEMVTTQAVPLMDADEIIVDNGIYNLAEETGGEAEFAEQSAPDDDTNPKDVEYSDIDFSLMKRKDPTEAGEQQDTETEYAEIKKEEIQERLDNAGADGEMLEGSEENQGMMGEDSETRILSAEEGEGEDAALYSNPDEIMAEAEQVV